MRYFLLCYSCCSILFSLPSIAQTPLRDLRVGNKFVYAYRYDPRQNLYYGRDEFHYEEVLSDTIIQGNKYAAVFNSAKRSIRYERSSDTAIHIWSGTGEVTSYRWNVVAQEQFYPSELANFAIPRIFQVQSVQRQIEQNSDTSVVAELVIVPDFFYTTVTMKKRFGITGLRISYRGTAPSQAFSYNITLVGAVIGGQVIGDTSFPRAIITIPPKMLAFEGDTLSVPVHLQKNKPEYPFRGWANLRILFNSSVLKLLDSVPPNRRKGDTVEIPNFPIEPDSAGLLGTLRFRVLASTTATTPITILQYEPIIAAPHIFELLSGVFQKKMPTTIPLNISVPQIQASSGERTTIAITLRGIQKLIANGITRATSLLSFNASLLEPIETTPRGSVQRGIRSIPLTFSLQAGMSDSITLNLPFRAAVGNAESTTLSVDSMRVTSTNAGIRLVQSIENGNFSLRGLNRAGGSAGLFFSNRTQLSAMPNPANESTHIAYTLEEAANIEILVFSITGEQILHLEKGTQSLGRYEVPITTLSLPSGAYHACLMLNGRISSRLLLSIIH
jgi:hypothetical protein